jgi:arsenite methyltransferase
MSKDSGEEIKKNVRAAYGAVARGDSRGCCAPGACCGGNAATEQDQINELIVSYSSNPEAVAKKLGYSEEELSSLPGEANLGLGCGNPGALASLRPGEIVLDLGSGAGMDCFLAAAKVGPTGKVIGVDMTRDMIVKAEENLARSDFRNIEFRHGEIESLPVDDAKVDVVISNCVLNLVPDKQQAFREIFRVLKPGGRIAVSDIVKLRALPAAIENDPDAISACIGGALMRDDYLAAISGAGLEDMKVVSSDDFGEMFLATPGPVSDRIRAELDNGDPTGYIASIKVTAVKR